MSLVNLNIFIDFNISHSKEKLERNPQDFYFKRMEVKRKMRRKKDKRNEKQMEWRKTTQKL